MKSPFLYYIALAFWGLISFNGFAQKASVDYSRWADPVMPGCIELSLNAELSPLEIPNLKAILEQAGLIKVERRFPHIKKPNVAINEQGIRLADLTKLYTVSVSDQVNLEKLIERLNGLPEVKVAEPHFLPSLCYVPSDDSISLQYALYKIQAFSAWDLHRGNADMRIGITDTGIEIFHPDIYESIALNSADPINGVDDDADGYVDNYYGWDTGDSDNDPSTTGNPHGQHISGIASATPDNQEGICGSGFNCKFVPIRIMNGDGVLSGAYEGLIYAAEHGCPVINCSWGGFQYSEINEEIVRFASINQNCLVICGAGNNNDNRLFYPASYNYAVSVGATDAQDIKADFSSFGDRIDVMAPGDLILSTWTNGEYQRSGGTSMSSPLVAGCAGIIRSAFPNLNGQQVRYQLRTTCDNIDSLSPNATWTDQMGDGRVNLFRALSENSHPAVVLNEASFYDSGDQLFLPGDTIELSGIFINYLAASNLSVATLECLTDNLEILNPQRTLGSLGTLESFSILDSPFKMVIRAGAEQGEEARLKLSILSDGEQNVQYFPIKLFASFVNITQNNVHTSVKGNGRIGVTGDQYIRGLGFRKLDGNNLLYEGGWLVGISSEEVYDVVRGENGSDEDWYAVNLVQRETIPSFTTAQYRGTMTNVSETSPLFAKVRYLADNQPENSNFVIAEFTLYNQSEFEKSGVYTGFFTDWDLADFSSNRAGFNAGLKLSYVHTVPNDTLYVGVQVLENLNTIPFALANASGSSSINPLDGFTTEEKYFALSNPSPEAGLNTGGSDIINFTSAGPFTIASQESIRVAFAFHIASNEEELFTQAVQARNWFSSVGIPLVTPETKDPGLVRVYPIPASDRLKIESQEFIEEIEITDLIGKKLIQKNPKGFNTVIDVMGLVNGYYTLHVKSKTGWSSQAVIIAR